MSELTQNVERSKKRPGPFGPAWALLPKGQQPLVPEGSTPASEAIRNDQPYQTHLDPTPGPPNDAEGKFNSIAQWDPNNWASHIHQPCEESEVAT